MTLINAWALPTLETGTQSFSFSKWFHVSACLAAPWAGHTWCKSNVIYLSSQKVLEVFACWYLWLEFGFNVTYLLGLGTGSFHVTWDTKMRPSEGKTLVTDGFPVQSMGLQGKRSLVSVFAVLFILCFLLICLCSFHLRLTRTVSNICYQHIRINIFLTSEMHFAKWYLPD